MKKQKATDNLVLQSKTSPRAGKKSTLGTGDLAQPSEGLCLVFLSFWTRPLVCKIRGLVCVTSQLRRTGEMRHVKTIKGDFKKYTSGNVYGPHS